MQPDIIDTTAAEITEAEIIATTAAEKQPILPDVVPTDPTTVSDNLRKGLSMK